MTGPFFLFNMMKQDLYKIRKISFEEIKSFWIRTNHFKVKNKIIREHVNYLGHFKNFLERPFYQAYGLYLEGSLVGVTMFYEWNKDWVRYRTIHILKEHRGLNLGENFLKIVYEKEWSHRKLFGWVRDTHKQWSEKVGFKEIDGVWSDNHIGMLLLKFDKKDKYKKIDENIY